MWSLKVKILCPEYAWRNQPTNRLLLCYCAIHGDVIKWKHFPRYWPLAWGIHRSPVNSPHKRLWRGALMFSLFCSWINGWVNNREASDLRRHRAHYDIIVMTRVTGWRHPVNEVQCTWAVNENSKSQSCSIFIVLITCMDITDWFVGK